MVVIGAALSTAVAWKTQVENKKEFAMKVLTEDPKIRKYMFTIWDGNEAKVQRMIDNISYDDLL
jgi:hypothetical protein